MIRRKSSLLALVLMACLALGLLLPGCGGSAATPPAAGEEEGVVEEARVADGAGSDEVSPPPEEPAAWCNLETDLNEILLGLGDDAAAGIQVEICIPGGLGVYTLEGFTGDSEYLDSALGIDGVGVQALLAFFKVKQGNDLATTFSPPLKMRITYSQTAWSQSTERGGGDFPRVAYLAWNGEDWEGTWVEFSSGPSQIVPPDPGDPESQGILEFEIDFLPDPLIGGC